MSRSGSLMLNAALILTLVGEIFADVKTDASPGSVTVSSNNIVSPAYLEQDEAPAEDAYFTPEAPTAVYSPKKPADNTRGANHTWAFVVFPILGVMLAVGILAAVAFQRRNTSPGVTVADYQLLCHPEVDQQSIRI